MNDFFKKWNIVSEYYRRRHYKASIQLVEQKDQLPNEQWVIRVYTPLSIIAVFKGSSPDDVMNSANYHVYAANRNGK
jgi:hypothetical protein